MSTPTEEELFFSEFIHDLYAEYEERLTTVRRILLDLEQNLPQDTVDDLALDTLLRHLHTLKGLAGTINLGDAEELTHQAEQYLRMVRQKQTELSPLGIEILVTALNNLESMIGAHQAQHSIPFNVQVLNALLRLVGTPNNTPEFISPESTTAEIVAEEPPLESTPRLWQFEFTPKPYLAEKGINVNQVRARLENLGELLEAKPILPQHGGELAFQFLLKTTAPEAQFAQWSQEGIHYQPYEALDSSTDEKLKLPSHSTSKEVVKAENCHPSPEKKLESTAHPSLEKRIDISSFDGSEEGVDPQLHSLPEELVAGTIPIPALRKGQGGGSPPLESEIQIEPSLTNANIVRVEMARLEELMRMVGELVTARSRQQNLFKQLKTVLPHQQWRLLQESNNQLERQLRSLHEGIMRVRMVPIGTAFERMKFVVRDLVKHNHKQIQLSLQGQDTQIDKITVDQLLDPLLHLVRNAVSHGIETPDERVRTHKPLQAQLTLKAETAGDAVIIQVTDDGRGIDLEYITQQARQRGLIAPEIPIDHCNLLSILCQPGFSTQITPDHTSGRGLGMDIVRRTLSKMGGTLHMKTQKGIGTQFTLQLPLTLAIIDALIIQAGTQQYAIPQLSIQEVLEISPDNTTVFDNHEIIRNREKILLLIPLTRLFNTLQHTPTQPYYALLLNDNLAITVDRILGQQEIVVQGLTDPLLQVPGISGATELGNGKLILILDLATLKGV